MSALVAVVFNDETTAFEMRTAVMRMQARLRTNLERSVVVCKSRHGTTTTLDQSASIASTGAYSGGFWGLLIGLIFLNPAGAVLGAGAGALSGWLGHVGVAERLMKALAKSLKPGTSALVVFTRAGTTEHILDGVSDYAGKGTVLQTPVDKYDEAMVREALEKSLSAAA